MLQNKELSFRIELALLGALAGFGFYILFEFLVDEIENQHLVVLIGALIYSFFGLALVLNGPLDRGKAIAASLVISLFSSVLVFWASFRFEQGLDDASYTFAVSFPWLLFLAVPFASVGLKDRSNWTNYDDLFDQAWAKVVRIGAALLFTCLFWGVYFLSNALLEVVGLRFLENLTRMDWFVPVVSGLVFGLAMAVLFEMQNVISTLRRLVLQLLRLLLPLVAVVTAIFLIMVPVRGFDDLFGNLSAGGTMLAIAVAGITFIAASIDGRDQDAAESRLMVVSGKVLSCLLIPLAGLAFYAIWLRVNQYGWTPERIIAALAALVVFAYAVLHGLSVLKRAQWRDAIRRGNVWVALGLIALAALWMTPILNPERISANNQLSRYKAGLTPTDELPLWELKEDWGRAGGKVLAKLRDHAESDRKLAQAFAALDKAKSRYDFKHDQQRKQALADRKSLEKFLRVYPDDRNLTSEEMDQLEYIGPLAKACKQKEKSGLPSCLVLIGDFDEYQTGDEMLVLWRRAYASSKVIRFGMIYDTPFNGVNNYRDFGHINKNISETLLDNIREGKFEIAPVKRNDIYIDGKPLNIFNR